MNLLKIMSGALFLAVNIAAQSQPPVISVVEAYDGSNSFSPASYAFVYATNLGPAPKVFVGSAACLTLSLTANYVSFQIPASLTPGPYSVTVQTAGGTSKGFSITVAATAPVILLNNANPPFSYFFDLTSVYIPVPTPSPGDRVYIYVDGIGPTRPPVAPQVLIDGQNVPVLLSTTFNALIGATNAGPVPAFLIQIPALPGGAHSLQVVAGSAASRIVQFTIIATGLFTSQTGLTFNAVQGGPAPPSQSFAVLNGTGTIHFSLAPSTVSGGTWLTATPSAGTSIEFSAGAPIQVQVNPSGLAIGTYYGSVTISSPDVPNSPQTVTVVLNVNAKSGPTIDKSGVIFIGATGGANPPSRAVTAFNPSLVNVSYTASLQGANLFTVTPMTGTLASGASQAFTIQTATAGLPPLAYPASLTLSFSDGTVRTVGILLVVATGAVSSASSLSPAPMLVSDTTNGACTPTKLLPVFTLLGNNFSVPAAWPTAIEATIVDDCGTAMGTGTAVITFSNGDSPLRLNSSSSGVWSGTWPPANSRASVTLTLAASEAQPALTGAAIVTGGVNANASVPQVNAGGVVEAAAYGAPVAPGNLVVVFGSALSTASATATAVPLPNQLQTTSVLIDGQFIPMYYTTAVQLSAMIPYGLSTNVKHQLVVQTGNSLSVPQSVLIGDARPGVYTTNESGSGQGHIYTITANGAQILAGQNTPAKAGNNLAVYCLGLGAVNPPLTAGTATPLSFLTTTVGTVTATIGGANAQVTFSGMTPGFDGALPSEPGGSRGITEQQRGPVAVECRGAAERGGYHGRAELTTPAGHNDAESHTLGNTSTRKSTRHAWTRAPRRVGTIH